MFRIPVAVKVAAAAIVLTLTNALAAAALARADTIAQVVVNVPINTPAGSTFYLTGEGPDLCNWNPVCIPLQYMSPAVYGATIRSVSGISQAQLKVTRGSWASEAVDAFGAPISNLVVAFAPKPSPFVYSVINWKDLPVLGVTGNVRLFPGFFSPQLGNSRTLEVWLPPSYGVLTQKRYPVIYMHDGQNLFNPKTSTTLVDWGVDETMTRLTEGGKVPEAIVVGIDVDESVRMLEYDYTQRGAAYSNFLIQTIKPFIDRNFRTLPDRNHTYTAGSSMGAMISLALLWHHSDVFSKAAGLSIPSSILNDVIYQIVPREPLPPNPIAFYMDLGTLGLDAEFYPETQNFYKYMTQTLGFPASNLEYLIYPYASHSEVDWARRVYVPLEWLLL